MNRPSVLAALLVASVLPTSTGCVFKKQYDAQVASAAKAKADADARDRDEQARILDLQQQLAAAQAMVQERDGKLSDLGTGLHNVQTQLDEATAINQELRAALERMGKDADKLLANQGTLAKALDDAKARLEELRRAQAAAEARTALFRDFAIRFKPLTDAGQMRFETRHGATVLEIASDLLFDTGKAELRQAGKGTLMEVARAMTTATTADPSRRFLVTGQLDDEAVKSKHARSVWALTAERAVTVVDYLVSIGVPAASLLPAGAGATDPLAPNDSDAARTRNRRIDIALMPADASGASAPAPAPAPVPAPGAAPAPAPARAPAPAPAPASPPPLPAK